MHPPSRRSHPRRRSRVPQRRDRSRRRSRDRSRRSQLRRRRRYRRSHRPASFRRRRSCSVFHRSYRSFHHSLPLRRRRPSPAPPRQPTRLEHPRHRRSRCPSWFRRLPPPNLRHPAIRRHLLCRHSSHTKPTKISRGMRTQTAKRRAWRSSSANESLRCASGRSLAIVFGPVRRVPIARRKATYVFIRTDSATKTSSCGVSSRSLGDGERTDLNALFSLEKRLVCIHSKA